MSDANLFEDFLWLSKAKNEDALLIKALVLSRLIKKSSNDETLRETKDFLMKKSSEEKMDVVINSLCFIKNLKYDSKKQHGGVYYCFRSHDSWKNELCVTLDDFIQYKANVSTGWSEKPRQEYIDLELSKKVSAIELYADIELLKEKGVSFEDAGKILTKKYSSLTLYRPQKRTHYLEGVLSANPNESKESTDYCLSLELSQLIDSDKKNVKAVLTVNTEWNFLKKK